jgi:hypothetical protein
MTDEQFEEAVAEARTTIELAEFAERADRSVAARQRINITGRAEPQKSKPLTSEDLYRAAAERFPEWLADVVRGSVGFEPIADTAARLPAKHLGMDDDAEKLMRFIDEFRRARHDQRRELKPELKVVRGSGAKGAVGGEGSKDDKSGNGTGAT